MILNSLFSQYYRQFGLFGFQDSATSLMEGIVELHAFVCFFLILISILVVWLLFQIIENYVLLPNSFTKVKPVDQFSKINLPMVFRMIAVSITARPGLDYRWDFENFDRESVLWNRILTLYIAIKSYQIYFYKMFFFSKISIFK